MMTSENEILRIVHFNSMLTGGGTDDQCLRLTEGLSRLGQSVTLAGPTARPLSPQTRPGGLQFFPLPSQKWCFVLSGAKLVRRQKAHVVHGHHGRDLWLTILAARLSGVRPRVVLTRHMAKSPSSLASRLFLLRQCDAVIAVSECVAKILREGADEPGSEVLERRHRPALYGDHSKIHVIYNGLDTVRFRPGDSADQRRRWGAEPQHYLFGVVGGFDLPRGKGQREFLEAAARIHKQAPDARFLLVGRGNMASLLQSDISRLGLEGKAWLANYCEDMPAGMNALDCIVHSQVGTEAFGMVLLEAFACGKPVIASKLDGIPEAFNAGGIGELVPAGAVEPLAEAMLRMTRQPGLTMPDREGLHSRVGAKFSVEVCARNVLSLYRRLIHA